MAVPLEGVRPVPDGMQPAAGERILHAADSLAIMRPVPGRPLSLEDARQRGRGHGGLGQERGEDDGHEGLEGLQDEGCELEETGLAGSGGEVVAVAGGVEYAGVDVGVEEAGDGEDGG